jgi:large subunit ribosomal protein L15
MKLNELKPTEGARFTKKRIGRGLGSGIGKTAGKGQKGQNSRSGGGVAIGFEGGQTPFFKRMPKRGFTNYTRKEYAVVNVGDLNKFDDGVEVDYTALKAAGLVKKHLDGVKVLGNGKLEKKLTVKAAKFSESAKKAIEDAGGKAEVL